MGDRGDVGRLWVVGGGGVWGIGGMWEGCGGGGGEYGV